MNATGVSTAPASKTVVVGPLFTGYGFKYWYWVCSSDSIVAVPQGLKTGIRLMLANHAAIMFGLLGSLVMALLRKRGTSSHDRLIAELAGMPTSELYGEPNVVFQLNQVQRIAFKGSSKLSGLLCPDLILETKSGDKRVFGMQPRDVKHFCTELDRLYPQLRNDA
jgi:hypothetical protein